MNDRLLTYRALAISTVTALCVLFAAFAQPAGAQSSPQTPSSGLILQAIQNELKDNSQIHLFAWKSRKNQARKTQDEYDVQTPSGTVSRVLLINGQPLNPRQQREEQARVRAMLDPEQMQQKLKDERADNARTRIMLAAIPDAFNFVYLRSETAPNGHKLDIFQFTPRPGYAPPSREIAVFTGMNGELTLDDTAMRLAKVDGTLFKDVNFGWGILGRLYKGGRFMVEKSEIAPNHWDTTHTLLHFDGKELIFKSLHINEDETDWGYKPVPPMSVKQALDYIDHSESPQDARLRP